MSLTRIGRIREKSVQSYLIERCNERGKAVKIDGSIVGTPDVLVKLRRYPAFLVECKRDENEDPKPHQEEQAKEWLKAGMGVRVVRTKRDVDCLLEDLYP